MLDELNKMQSFVKIYGFKRVYINSSDLNDYSLRAICKCPITIFQRNSSCKEIF